MYFLALRNLWVRKTRTLLTLFGVALGVAFVLAVNITNASTQKSLEAFFAQTSGRANLSVSNAASLSVQTGIRATVLREAQAFPGVIAALIGVGAGLALLAVMIKGMEVNSGWSLSYVFPTMPLIVSIAITLVVSQVAALYPTWRAVKTVIVESIQSE
jgi:ABC-type antimicrobial peptide transport system permease subunit